MADLRLKTEVVIEVMDMDMGVAIIMVVTMLFLVSLEVDEMKIQWMKVRIGILKFSGFFFHERIFFVTILELTLIEKKSFEICDENQDGGLSWPEVDYCEVFYYFVDLKFHKLFFVYIPILKIYFLENVWIYN